MHDVPRQPSGPCAATALPYTLNPGTALHASRFSAQFNPNLYNEGKVCLSLLGTWQVGKVCLSLLGSWWGARAWKRSGLAAVVLEPPRLVCVFAWAPFEPCPNITLCLLWSLLACACTPRLNLTLRLLWSLLWSLRRAGEASRGPPTSPPCCKCSSPSR